MKRALVAALLRRRRRSAARALEKLPDNVGVVEKLGERVPRDLAFTDENGKRGHARRLPRTTASPCCIALVYYKCPLLCSLTLNGIVGALRQQTWKLGQEYRVITVSFDPDEKPDARARRSSAAISARSAFCPRSTARTGRSSPATRRTSPRSPTRSASSSAGTPSTRRGTTPPPSWRCRPTARSRATCTACSIRRTT